MSFSNLEKQFLVNDICRRLSEAHKGSRCVQYVSILETEETLAVQVRTFAQFGLDVYSALSTCEWQPEEGVEASCLCSVLKLLSQLSGFNENTIYNVDERGQNISDEGAGK